MYSTKDHIIRVLFPFEGHRIGGSHISGALVAEALREYSDVEVDIVLHQDGPVAEFLQRRSLNWRLLPMSWAGKPLTKPRYLNVLLRDVPRLAIDLRKHSVDIVHSNDSTMHVTWGVAARLGGVQHVWHQRGRKWARSPLQDMRRTAVIAISRFVLDSYPCGPPKSTLMTHNPFDVDPMRGATRAQARVELETELEVAPGTPLIGFVSNYRDYKRPEFFIRMAAALSGRRRDCHFVMAGEEYDVPLSRLEAMVKHHGLSRRFHFLGFRMDSARLMAALDVLVVPAVDEPFGRTLVEAFLVGTPVVGADSGGHREIVPEWLSDWLIAPDDMEGFVDQVIDLLDEHATTRERADRVRAWSVERFSARRHAAEVREFYLSVLGNDSAR